MTAPREIDFTHTAGVYVLAGRLRGDAKGATPHFYVGESLNVHGRLHIHQKLDKTACESRRRNNYPRWFGRGCRMILLTEIADQDERRLSEERFIAAALMLGLSLLNRKQPKLPRIQLLGTLDNETKTLKQALAFLGVDSGQFVAADLDAWILRQQQGRVA